MGINLDAVVVESSRARKANSYTDSEKAIAHDAVVEVIEQLGGVPTLANGNVSEGYFVKAIRAKLGDDSKSRPFASWAYLARKALKDLRGTSKARKAS